MLLAIDIDNKTTNIGVFDKNELIESFSIMTELGRTSSELKLTIKLILLDKDISLGQIDDIIISSVVPELTRSFEDLLKSIISKDPILISSGVKTGLNIKCESPKEVGSDRIIRAVGTTALYKDNLIIVSASSITTIDFINDKNQFLGGAILPGINLLENSLHNQSAKLPQVEIKSMDKVLGNNTISSIQSGIYYGYINAIFGIVYQIIDEYSLDDNNTSIVVTGEFANFLDNKKYKLKFVENLGLYGLNHIYKLNNK